MITDNIAILVVLAVTLLSFIGVWRLKRKDDERIKTIRFLRERVDQLEQGMRRSLDLPKEDFRAALVLHVKRMMDGSESLHPDDKYLLKQLQYTFSDEVLDKLRRTLSGYNEYERKYGKNIDGLTPDDLKTLEAVEKAFPEIGAQVKELLRNNRAMQGGLTK